MCAYVTTGAGSAHGSLIYKVWVTVGGLVHVWLLSKMGQQLCRCTVAVMLLTVIMGGFEAGEEVACAKLVK